MRDPWRGPRGRGSPRRRKPRPGGFGTGEISRQVIRWSRPGNLRLLAALLLLAMALFGLLPPGEIRGAAEAVDGDSLIVSGERVRLYAVDAPELDQPCRTGGPCGERARARLAELVAGKAVTCEKRDMDRYGRHVAQCYIMRTQGAREPSRGEDVGRVLVREGQAMAYRAIAPTYAADEPPHFDFEPPWDWRERHGRGAR